MKLGSFILLLILLAGCQYKAAELVPHNTKLLREAEAVGYFSSGEALYLTRVYNGNGDSTDRIYFIRKDGNVKDTTMTVISRVGKNDHTIVVDGIEYIPAENQND